MGNVLFEEIPSLDLADFRSENLAAKTKFVLDLGQAYNNIGFVAIKGHGLSESLRKELYETIESFFKLPEEIKRKYENEALAGQRGYIGKGKEHAKGRSTGDLKEFYHVGQIVEGEDSIAADYPDNIWPEEITDFQRVTSQVYKLLEATGKEMLRAIALYLELPETYFEDKVKNGNSILRPIHYYPIENPDDVPEDAVRAAEHGDINLITLLMGASADGLQVLRKDGKWIPITALPDQLIVNVGDMLARLTNDKLKSTIHRVVNPPREMMNTSRYSIPFFMHPRSEMNLTCLDSCIDKDHPKKYEDMSAGQFLKQRLEEIGLLKK